MNALFEPNIGYVAGCPKHPGGARTSTYGKIPLSLANHVHYDATAIQLWLAPH